MKVIEPTRVLNVLRPWSRKGAVFQCSNPSLLSTLLLGSLIEILSVGCVCFGMYAIAWIRMACDLQTLPLRLGLISLSAVLLCSRVAAIAQNGAISFWSLPPARVNAMLADVPADDQGRYQRLRDDFAGLHCGSDQMQEQPTGRQEGKNLICTLPGKDSAQIVVVARYERKGGRSVGASQRWSEALMLPLLYNALRAQPRAHTFVFAEVYGAAGEKTFFDELRKKTPLEPSALVVLDALGLGTPSIYTARPAGTSKKKHELAEVKKLLESEAIFSANVLGLPDPIPPMPAVISTGQFAIIPNARVIDNSILAREYETPSILILSNIGSMTPSFPDLKANHTQPPLSISADVSAEAFHLDFNFVAYFLCRIDLKLALPA